MNGSRRENSFENSRHIHMFLLSCDVCTLQPSSCTTVISRANESKDTVQTLPNQSISTELHAALGTKTRQPARHASCTRWDLKQLCSTLDFRLQYLRPAAGSYSAQVPVSFSSSCSPLPTIRHLAASAPLMYRLSRMKVLLGLRRCRNTWPVLYGMLEIKVCIGELGN